MDTPTLHGVPTPLWWENPPVKFRGGSNELLITAGKETDLFRDPLGMSEVDTSPRLLFRPDGDFTLSSRVKVNFNSTFDAGVLILYDSFQQWAKLCFELTPEGRPCIVSVVNHGFSDDCNSMPIDGNEVYLRLARIDNAFAFHFSHDAKYWYLVRYFTLGDLQNAAVGFSVQSPKGDCCKAGFTDIHYTKTRLQDVRSGE